MPLLLDFLRSSLVLGLCVALGFGPGAHYAFAGPENPVVQRGVVAIDRVDATTWRITANDGSIVHYDSFDILRNELVNFALDGNESRILNRIFSENATQILGRLESNGHVYFVNPAGVIIGADARIDANGFHAAAGQLSDDDFLDGSGDHYRDLTGNVTVEAGADVQARDLSLIGKMITNDADIIANDGGWIVLAAGDDVFVGRQGDVMLRLEGVYSDGSIAAPETTLTNRGNLSADQSVSLAAGAQLESGDLVGTALFNQGAITARRIALRGSAEVETTAGVLDAVEDGSVEVRAQENVVYDTTVANAESLTLGTRAISLLGAGASASAGRSGLDASGLGSQDAARIEIEADQGIDVQGAASSDVADLTLRADRDGDGFGDLEVGAGNSFSTQGSLVASGSNVDVAGELRATGSVDVTAADDLVVSGVVGSSGPDTSRATLVASSGELTLAAGGEVAADDIELRATARAVNVSDAARLRGAAGGASSPERVRIEQASTIEGAPDAALVTTAGVRMELASTIGGVRVDQSEIAGADLRLESLGAIELSSASGGIDVQNLEIVSDDALTLALDVSADEGIDIRAGTPDAFGTPRGLTVARAGERVRLSAQSVALRTGREVSVDLGEGIIVATPDGSDGDFTLEQGNSIDQQTLASSSLSADESADDLRGFVPEGHGLTLITTNLPIANQDPGDITQDLDRLQNRRVHLEAAGRLELEGDGALVTESVTLRSGAELIVDRDVSATAAGGRVELHGGATEFADIPAPGLVLADGITLSGEVISLRAGNGRPNALDSTIDVGSDVVLEGRALPGVSDATDLRRVDVRSDANPGAGVASNIAAGARDSIEHYGIEGRSVSIDAAGTASLEGLPVAIVAETNVTLNGDLDVESLSVEGIRVGLNATTVQTEGDLDVTLDGGVLTFGHAGLGRPEGAAPPETTDLTVSVGGDFNLRRSDGEDFRDGVQNVQVTTQGALALDAQGDVNATSDWGASVALESLAITSQTGSVALGELSVSGADRVQIEAASDLEVDAIIASGESGGAEIADLGADVSLAAGGTLRVESIDASGAAFATIDGTRTREGGAVSLTGDAVILEGSVTSTFADDPVEVLPDSDPRMRDDQDQVRQNIGEVRIVSSNPVRLDGDVDIQGEVVDVASGVVEADGRDALFAARARQRLALGDVTADRVRLGAIAGDADGNVDLSVGTIRAREIALRAGDGAVAEVAEGETVPAEQRLGALPTLLDFESLTLEQDASLGADALGASDVSGGVALSLISHTGDVALDSAALADTRLRVDSAGAITSDGALDVASAELTGRQGLDVGFDITASGAAEDDGTIVLVAEDGDLGFAPDGATPRVLDARSVTLRADQVTEADTEDPDAAPPLPRVDLADVQVRLPGDATGQLEIVQEAGIGTADSPLPTLAELAPGAGPARLVLESRQGEVRVGQEQVAGTQLVLEGRDVVILDDLEVANLRVGSDDGVTITSDLSASGVDLDDDGSVERSTSFIALDVGRAVDPALASSDPNSTDTTGKAHLRFESEVVTPDGGSELSTLRAEDIELRAQNRVLPVPGQSVPGIGRVFSRGVEFAGLDGADASPSRVAIAQDAALASVSTLVNENTLGEANRAPDASNFAGDLAGTHLLLESADASVRIGGSNAAGEDLAAFLAEADVALIGSRVEIVAPEGAARSFASLDAVGREVGLFGGDTSVTVDGDLETTTGRLVLNGNAELRPGAAEAGTRTLRAAGALRADTIATANESLALEGASVEVGAVFVEDALEARSVTIDASGVRPGRAADGRVHADFIGSDGGDVRVDGRRIELASVVARDDGSFRAGTIEARASERIELRAGGLSAEEVVLGSSDGAQAAILAGQTTLDARVELIAAPPDPDGGTADADALIQDERPGTGEVVIDAKVLELDDGVALADDSRLTVQAERDVFVDGDVRVDTLDLSAGMTPTGDAEFLGRGDLHFAEGTELDADAIFLRAGTLDTNGTADVTDRVELSNLGRIRARTTDLAPDQFLVEQNDGIGGGAITQVPDNALFGGSAPFDYTLRSRHGETIVDAADVNGTRLALGGTRVEIAGDVDVVRLELRGETEVDGNVDVRGLSSVGGILDFDEDLTVLGNAAEGAPDGYLRVAGNLIMAGNFSHEVAADGTVVVLNDGDQTLNVGGGEGLIEVGQDVIKRNGRGIVEADELRFVSASAQALRASVTVDRDDQPVPAEDVSLELRLGQRLTKERGDLTIAVRDDLDLTGVPAAEPSGDVPPTVEALDGSLSLSSTRGRILLDGSLAAADDLSVAGDTDLTAAAVPVAGNRSLVARSGTLHVEGGVHSDTDLLLDAGTRITSAAAVVVDGDVRVADGLTTTGTASFEAHNVRLGGDANGSGNLTLSATQGNVELSGPIGLDPEAALELRARDSIEVAPGRTGLSAGAVTIGRNGGQTGVLLRQRDGDLTIVARRGGVTVAPEQEIVVVGDLAVAGSDGVTLDSVAALGFEATGPSLTLHPDAVVMANRIAVAEVPGGGSTFATPTASEISRALADDDVLVRAIDPSGRALTRADLVAALDAGVPAPTGPARFRAAREKPLEPRAEPGLRAIERARNAAALAERPLYADEVMAFLSREPGAEPAPALGGGATALWSGAGAAEVDPRLRSIDADRAAAIYWDFLRPYGDQRSLERQDRIRSRFQAAVEDLRARGAEVDAANFAALIEQAPAHADALQDLARLSSLLMSLQRLDLTRDEYDTLRVRLVEPITPEGLTPEQLAEAADRRP